MFDCSSTTFSAKNATTTSKSAKNVTTTLSAKNATTTSKSAKNVTNTLSVKNTHHLPCSKGGHRVMV